MGKSWVSPVFFSSRRLVFQPELIQFFVEKYGRNGSQVQLHAGFIPFGSVIISAISHFQCILMTGDLNALHTAVATRAHVLQGLG